MPQDIAHLMGSTYSCPCQSDNHHLHHGEIGLVCSFRANPECSQYGWSGADRKGRQGHLAKCNPWLAVFYTVEVSAGAATPLAKSELRCIWTRPYVHKESSVTWEFMEQSMQRDLLSSTSRRTKNGRGVGFIQASIILSLISSKANT